jgi:hypothetical protein
MDYELPAQHENLSLARAEDVRRWTHELDVTEAELRTAVQNVGFDTANVRNYIATHRRRHRTNVR